MQIPMVSDIHYSKKPFHGRDQSKAFDWLYSIIGKEKTDLLLSTGDFGDEATLDLFSPVLEKNHLLITNGNHDDVKLIQDIRNKDNSPCWLQDGVIEEYEGLKIAGISGNIARDKRKVHHKTVEEVRRVISKYVHLGKAIDVPITHEPPKHKSINRNKMLGYGVFNEARERLKPKLHFCGHVHIPSQILEVNRTTVLNLDSSPRHQEYAMAEWDEGKICDIRISSTKS